MQAGGELASVHLRWAGLALCHCWAGGVRRSCGESMHGLRARCVDARFRGYDGREVQL